MSRMILITGGCRSGKSRHALRLAENAESPRLFIATVMYSASQRGEVMREAHIVQHCREVCAAVRGTDALVIFVTNEVGMGIVP